MDTGDTAWMLTSTALVMIMLPGLALFYGGLVRRKNVLSTIMHSFFGLALVSVVWVIVGFSLAFGPDVIAGSSGGLDRRPRLHRVQRRRSRAEHDLRHDDPVRPVRGVPADVRGHHAGADHRRLRRAQAVRRLRPVHDPLVDPRLLPDRPLGLVESTAGSSSSARSTSPAAPSSTISSGVSALIVAILIGRRVVNGEQHGAARRADDRPRRGPPVVRLVRLQRRLGADAPVASRPAPSSSPTPRPPRRPSPGSSRATSTRARSASSAPPAAPSPASSPSPRRRAS